MKFKTVNWITNKKSSSYKPQATSRKLQATEAASFKRQATGKKVKLPFYKGYITIKPRYMWQRNCLEFFGSTSGSMSFKNFASRVGSQ